MEIKEMKEKFEALKKRLSNIEKVVAVAESQKKDIETRLKKEYDITPDKLQETIDNMQIHINKTKDSLKTALVSFEDAITKVEKIINV